MRPEDKIDQILTETIRHDTPEFDFEAFKAAHPDQIAAFHKESSFSAHKRTNRLPIRPSTFVKYALAASLIIAAGLIFRHMTPKPQSPPQPTAQAALMGRLALTMAYSQGGMDAVEEQYNKAYAKLGPRAGGVSMNSLLNQ